MADKDAHLCILVVLDIGGQCNLMKDGAEEGGQGEVKGR